MLLHNFPPYKHLYLDLKNKMLKRHQLCRKKEDLVFFLLTGAGDHEQVARLVACGAADAGIAIESVALAAGLGFVPLSEERFDLALPAERAAEPAVARILDALGDAAFRREVARLPGYDISLTGQTSLTEAA
jgi:molybdate-binding protein